MTNPVHLDLGNSKMNMPIAPHEDYPGLPLEVSFSKLSNEHAFKVHMQSLERIRQRGGMSAPELYWNLTRSNPVASNGTVETILELLEDL
mgnify:CR=1 FL=1|tara:strand:- start:8081 stop:8350 length:270 start_codon:yes stop_codon:yes gene_type:complete